MIITQPDPYLLPTYRLSPFTTADVHRNARLEVDTETIENYWKERLPERRYKYVKNGRAAIYSALSHYQLQKEDVVTILTTTDNHYISGCVTREIEKFCSWSRIMEKRTKVLFVNHEFGYPREGLPELQALGYPIIEDCAYSFFSEDSRGNTGRIGDFTIYSFPKMFPLQIGGLLTSREDIILDIQEDKQLAGQELVYVQMVLSYYISQAKEIKRRRRENQDYLLSRLRGLGWTERLPMKTDTVPGVCLAHTPERHDLQQLKEFLWGRGIQCSVFYGEEAFFLPVHQALEKEDLDYITSSVFSFLQQAA